MAAMELTKNALVLFMEKIPENDVDSILGRSALLVHVVDVSKTGF